MPRQLIVVAGPDRGQIFTLPEHGSVTVGRGREADVRLNDLRVSRMQFRLDIAGQITLHDMGSAGGTFVNGRRIGSEVVKAGDVIRLGETDLRVQEAALADLPTVPPEAPRAAIPAAIPVAAPAAIPVAMPVQAQPAADESPVGLTGRRLGDFQVGSLLAQGNSGVVFRGRDLRNGQEVALKVLWPHLAHNRDVVKRFWRGVNIIREIRHPNLVTLYEAGQSGPHCWLALEFIDGENLMQVIERIGVAGMLDWRHAFRVALHVGRALHTIHERQIIHRNLAPQNILIRRSDQSAVLGDVVLAKALEGTPAQQITRPGEILGDVRYMAPEQVSAGESIDARADIYCLGAMLYALLTGRPPLAGGSLVETVKLVRHAEPIRPKKFQMSINDRFEGVVMKMLAKNPQARFQNAQDFLEELAQLGKFQGLPIS